MRNKYHVSPKAERTLDGRTFASKAEMNRYAELCMMEKAGLIFRLMCQPRFVLQEGYVRKASVMHPAEVVKPMLYFADFAYNEPGNSLRVVEDVKGYKTKEYQLKKKLLLAKYPGIDFREVHHGR